MNKRGFSQLKSDLRRNAQHYNQQQFGKITPECGTECCLAGMCLMRQLGMKEFTKRVKAYWRSIFARGRRRPISVDLMGESLAAASKQLGLKLLTGEQYEELAELEGREGDSLPPIFSSAEYWPEDLSERYADASVDHDHEAMAKVAIEALDRIDERGVFVR